MRRKSCHTQYTDLHSKSVLAAINVTQMWLTTSHLDLHETSTCPEFLSQEETVVVKKEHIAFTKKKRKFQKSSNFVFFLTRNAFFSHNFKIFLLSTMNAFLNRKITVI